MAIDKTRFLTQFKAETRDHLARLNQGILGLEKAPRDAETLQRLMKEAHTVKGSATMMGFASIAEIAHKMEDGFEAAQGRPLTLAKDDYDLLFECLDVIESLLEGTAVRKARSLDATYVADLVRRLAEAFAPDRPQPDVSKTRTPQSEVKDAAGSPSKPPGAAPEVRPIADEESLRVEVSTLNGLMNLSGELLIAKIRLSDLVKRLVERAERSVEVDREVGDLVGQLNAVDETIRMIVSDMQERTLSLRMVAVANLFQSFPRAMRDLANQHGKDIGFEIKGEETHLDKAIIDRMRDPLMHLLRNAVDHGIEDPQTRLNRGKSAQGLIRLIASRTGSQVVLEVSDDGDGIDLDKVRQQAVRKGLISRAAADSMTADQVYNLLFTPGFSTREAVTETSGRGVGLDVVRSEIIHLKGTIEIESRVGAGTRFILKLPLTLSIAEALLVACGDDVFAVPMDAIQETTRIGPEEVESVETQEVMTLRGQITPLVRIHQVFSLPRKGIAERRYLQVVVVHSAEKRLGLCVDEVLGHQDIVIKPLGDPIGRVPNVAGGTILGDGRVVLILDVPAMVQSAGQSGVPRTAVSATGPRSLSGRRVLLAEDTPSTAMLEKSVLEAAGLVVVHAKDGQEALDTAARERFDLVITDVLMPRMNGFELTSLLKRNSRTKDWPVVIVTTRGSDADKQRGLDAGADAYILKKDFTSDSFIETIDRLLTGSGTSVR